MLKLFRLITPYRGYVALVLVLALAQSIGSLLLPRLMAEIVDQGIVKGDQRAILQTGGLMLLGGEDGAHRALVEAHELLEGQVERLGGGYAGTLTTRSASGTTTRWSVRRSDGVCTVPPGAVNHKLSSPRGEVKLPEDPVDPDAQLGRPDLAQGSSVLDSAQVAV